MHIKGQLNKERRRWIMRYLKKIRSVKNKTCRILKALLIICAVFYLTAVWGLRERIFQVRKENTVILREEVSEQPGGSFKKTLYKIILRLKTGEIVLYNEKTW